MILGNLDATRTTRFRTVLRRNSVRQVAEVFADIRVGLIVVCDEQGRAVGVVSKWDLVRHLAVAGSIDDQVTQVMAGSVVAGSPGDDLRQTLELMVSKRLQTLPVLTPDRRPVGILDIRDALEALLRLEQQQEDHLIGYIAGIGYR
jgi:CBS domain-containing protein